MMDKDTLREILAAYMPPAPWGDEPVIDGDYVSVCMGNAVLAWGYMAEPDRVPALCKGAQDAFAYAVRELAYAPDKLNALPLLVSYPDFTDNAKENIDQILEEDPEWRVYAMWRVEPRSGAPGWRIKAYLDYGWTPTWETIRSYIVTPDMSATRLATMIETHYPWRMFE